MLIICSLRPSTIAMGKSLWPKNGGFWKKPSNWRIFSEFEGEEWYFSSSLVEVLLACHLNLG